jgi:hypothetical protein
LARRLREGQDEILPAMTLRDELQDAGYVVLISPSDTPKLSAPPGPVSPTWPW